MDLYESYSYLFADCFMSALILPPQTNLAFVAMEIFGGYNEVLMISLASLGASIGIVINLFFGKILTSLIKINSQENWIFKIRSFAGDKINYLIALCFIPSIGPIISVVAGLIGSKIKIALPIIVIVNILYYSLLLIT